MAKSLIIMLADGLEEAELVLPFDLCYRAGISVQLVAVSEKLLITSSHGLKIEADCTLHDFLQSAPSPDAVFLPGGMPGSKHLAENQDLKVFLQDFARDLVAEGRYLAAICAAPAHVLGWGTRILQGKNYTCYPGAESVVPEDLRAQKREEAIVEDGNILTATGVASAHLLGERLIELLVGKDVAEQVMRATLF